MMHSGSDWVPDAAKAPGGRALVRASVRARSRTSRGLAAGLAGALAFGLAACAPLVPAVVHGPADPGLEVAAVDTTRLGQPLHVVFDWRARDAEASFRGRGVARAQPEYQVRLDLFGPRDETLLVASLIAGDLWLPGEPVIPVPPPPLLWSTLGVFWPPPGGELVIATRDNNEIRLEYAEGRDRWRFRLENGRLRHAEWERAGRGRHTVELRDEAPYRLPRRAVYRDWVAFVELILTVEEVEHVASFPAEIFRPDAR